MTTETALFWVIFMVLAGYVRTISEGWMQTAYAEMRNGWALYHEVMGLFLLLQGLAVINVARWTLAHVPTSFL